MAGARNVCHFAWEFDVMKDRGLVAESILRNQIHMLGLMDEIWVGCEFTRTVVQRYGLPNVHVVPAPVVDETLPTRLGLAEALEYLHTVPVAPLLLAGALSREHNAALLGSRIAPFGAHPALACKRAGLDCRIFLAVANPGDLRKNLLNLIEGFQIATDRRSSDVLLVKLIVPNKGNFREEALYEHLLPRCNGDAAYDDPRVVFMIDYLTDLQMDALFSIADYYVSPTHCEGFNRPLLQAMSFGTVPISTCNTAMTDYITSANAILIREVPYVGIIPGMAGDVAGVPYEVSFASRFDIAHALRAAMHQDPEERAAMADQSRLTVLEKYGLPEIRRRAEARVAALLREPAEAANG
jgi:glycosyltransferase involved in cell wall biosynthesis